MEENALNCGHGCCGGVCGGCGSTLELTQQELDLLYLFAQTPFLPVARENDSELPVFLEIDADDAGLFASAIIALAKKGLIRLDYDMPLINFDYAGYEDYPDRGSMALTGRGQIVVEQIEILGIEEQNVC